MALKLYDSPFSSNARKVRIVAALLGIDLELVPVDLQSGSQRGADHMARNPMGKVPVLEDGELMLPESAAIMIYLAESRGETSLYPREPRARAEVNRWLFWGAAHWAPALEALAFENAIKRVMGLGDPEPIQVQRQEQQIRSLGRLLDQHLGARPWLAGSSLTLADIAIGTSLMNAARFGAPLESYSRLAAWYDRIRALDAWQATEPTAPSPFRKS